MRPPRLALFVALVAACTGCGDAAPTSTPATAGASTVATSAITAEALTATTTTTTTSTTKAPPTTSTTTAPPTTTTTAGPPEASPTMRLSSFRWRFLTSVRSGDTELLSVESEGVFADGAFDCEITAGLGDFELSTRLVQTQGTTSFDDGGGDGLLPVAPDDERVVDSLRLCAGSGEFWADVTGGEPLPAGGEPEERNGVPTRRLQLAGVLDQAAALGLFTPGVEGVTIDTVTFWVADPGDWISGFFLTAGLEPSAVSEITGSNLTENGEIVVELEVTDPDDPSLAVTPP